MLKTLGWIIFIFLAIIGFLALCVYFFPDAEAQEEGTITISIDDLSIEQQQEIKEENFWDDLVSIVIQIESGGNPYAVSKAGCIGLMQISPIILKEFNEYACSGGCIPGWNMSLMFDGWYNRYVGTWYINKRIPQLLKHYSIPDTIKNRLIAWHDGIGNLVKFKEGKRKLGKEMQSYLKKYHKLAK